MLKSGKFTPGEIDSQWTTQIREAFMKWLDEHPKEPRITRAQLDAFMEKRTW